jgi:hypothetical protein
MGWRAPLFYLLLLAVTVSLGFWVDRKWEKTEYDYLMLHTSQRG